MSLLKKLNETNGKIVCLEKRYLLVDHLKVVAMASILINLVKITNLKKRNKMVSNNTRSGLPREVWRWLLGLDLPIAITNPRRDFQNGENIATILNHYCGRNQTDRKAASKIEISFFNRGTSLKSLEGNWALIQNFLGECSELHNLNFNKILMKYSR